VFGAGDTNGRGTYILIGVKFVAADCHAYAIRFSFAGVHGADKVGIGNLVSSRNVVWRNKKDGLIANNLIDGGSIFGNALSVATPLVCQRGRPNVFVEALKKGINGFRAACAQMEHFAGDCGVILNRLCKV
jgi:hypothetical protein